MDKGICIAVPATVTISTDEYRDLVTAQAYLSVIAEAKKNDRSYVADNVVEIISRLVSPVITAEQPSSGDEDGETDA